MVAPDGVVVGDRSSRGDDRVACGLLHLVPLRDLIAAAGRCQNRVIRSGAVGIEVREAAANAARFAERFTRGADDGFVERREAIPSDRRLKGVGENPELDEHVADVRHLDKGLAPVALCRWARPARRIPLAAVAGGDLQRPLKLVVDRGVGRLKADHQH